jgi:hypothetical protein
MKYRLQKLDGRYSYRENFEYCLIFGKSINHGLFDFSEAQNWFFDTYGWSAEVRQWKEFDNWWSMQQIVANTHGYLKNERPIGYNPYWSWTNGYDDLRIYVATKQELTLFALKYPVDR